MIRGITTTALNLNKPLPPLLSVRLYYCNTIMEINAASDKSSINLDVSISKFFIQIFYTNTIPYTTANKNEAER